MRNDTVGPGIWWEKWKKNGNWETHTVGREYGKKHGKMGIMRNNHFRNFNIARNTEKSGKWEMHTVGSGIWRETLKNEENKKCTL